MPELQSSYNLVSEQIHFFISVDFFNVKREFNNDFCSLTLSGPLLNQWTKFLSDFISNMSDVYSITFH
jgi:hypothetical protein